MPVKLRLQRRGRKKQPFYHIVAADARAPRDGKFIEKIGTYNPMTKPATIDLDRDRAYDWLMNGAQPTNTVRAILRFKGVLYKKHLQRGVDKGAITQESADAKLQDWIDSKESKVAARVEQTAQERAARLEKLSGQAPPPPAPEPVEEPAVEEAAAEDAVATDEATEAAAEEAPAAEAEPTAEAPTEEAAPAETPAAEETPATEAKEEAPAEEATADEEK